MHTNYEPHQPMVEATDEIDLLKLFTVFLRGKYFLLFGLFAGLLIGIAYVATVTPVYTSSVHISVGSAEAENARELSGVTGVTLDVDQITTEVQVLRSEQIAARVVDAMDLSNNEAFLTSPQSGVSRLTGGIGQLAGFLIDNTLAILKEAELPDVGLTEEEEAAKDRQDAIARLRGNMSVSQVSRSRVLQVSYTSVSPTLSARIANEIAKAYIDDQLSSKFEATQRATNWLKERTDQLRVQSGLLNNAVEAFRKDNNLVGVGGDLSSDTQLEVLNRQVADMRAELLALEARANRLAEIVTQNDTSAFVSSTATQSITANLRTQYLENLRDYNSLLGSLGEDHEQTQRRKRDLVQLEGLMFEEIKRSEIVAQNDVGEARERLAKLEEAQEIAANQLGADNTTLIELRELERNADTVRSLYTSFLQRYQQSLQEQGFPVTDARVLNPARIPENPSAPRLSMIAALSAILGFMIAAAWVLIKDLRDNKLRTEDQIRRVLGLEFLGGLDFLDAQRRLPQSENIELKERQLALPELMTYAGDHPLSSYAEALRTGNMSVSLKVGEEDRAHVIGVVSCFPGEGKTTTAANFASLLAAQGSVVLLIDGDLRNPGLSRSLVGEVQQGLVDVLLDDAKWEDVIYTEKSSGLHIIPNRRGRVVHTSELLGGRNMERLLTETSEHYDVIIVDLPPLGPVIDARAVLHNLDGLFFVAKWGETNIKHAESIMLSDPRLLSKCYGAFLNMFDAKKAASYGSYEGSAYYYGKSYKSYYRDH